MFNSAHPSTLIEFIEHNYVIKKNLSRSNLLTSVLHKKIKKLEEKASLLNKKILFEFKHLNQTNDNLHFNQIENNNYQSVNIYYLKNIRDSLSEQLNRYLHQINLLKQFENKIIK